MTRLPSRSRAFGPRPMAATALSAISLSAGLALAAPASAAPSLEVRDAAARLIVIPEARSDVQVDVERRDLAVPMLQIRREGDHLIVDGGLRGRIVGCSAVNAGGFVAMRHRPGETPPGARVNIRGVGVVPVDRLPVITVRTPVAAAVAAGGAVYGEVGATDRLQLAKSGCGDIRVAPVRGDFDLLSSGSGDTGFEHAGRLRARLSGSGDLDGGDVGGDVDVNISGSADARLGRVAGGLAVAVAGSGDVRATEINGAFNATVAGSGNVRVDAGRAPQFSARVAGSGDVTFGGEAGAVNALTFGSGDIRIARATGPISRMARGSGEITIGR